MDAHSLTQLLAQVLPPTLVHRGLEVVGALTLLSQIVPRLLAWGIPAATRGADWVARTLLDSPLRPLILWKAKDIAAFLDELTDALEQIANTFKSRLEKDLEDAAQQPAPETSDAPKGS
jgi:hypothetical protein